eukprot:gene2033-17123_t
MYFSNQQGYGASTAKMEAVLAARASVDGARAALCVFNFAKKEKRAAVTVGGA